MYLGHLLFKFLYIRTAAAATPARTTRIYGPLGLNRASRGLFQRPFYDHSMQKASYISSPDGGSDCL